MKAASHTYTKLVIWSNNPRHLWYTCIQNLYRNDHLWVKKVKEN